MLLLPDSEMNSMMTSESSVAPAHHDTLSMLGHPEDPATFTPMSCDSACAGSPLHKLSSPSHSPPMVAVAASAAGGQQGPQQHAGALEDYRIHKQELQQLHGQQQLGSSQHQWDINDSVLPSPKVHDGFCLWPTGHCRRTYRGDSDDARRHVSGWAMRNTNNHNALILKKSCLGVLVCSRDCVLDSGRKVHLRPAICDKARRKQLAKPCPNPNCSGRLELLACRGHCGYPVTHFWRHLNGYVYFQAKGYHDHPRPDVKSLSEKGRSVFNKQLKQEGGRTLPLLSKRRFPILTSDDIPDFKRFNHSHDEVMCSCPPFECVCPKPKRGQQPHIFNPPHCGYEPQGPAPICSTSRLGLAGLEPALHETPPVTALAPQPFTQINITNTCLPSTTLDLNLQPTVEIKGCYPPASEPQFYSHHPMHPQFHPNHQQAMMQTSTAPGQHYHHAPFPLHPQEQQSCRKAPRAENTHIEQDGAEHTQKQCSSNSLSPAADGFRNQSQSPRNYGRNFLLEGSTYRQDNSFISTCSSVDSGPTGLGQTGLIYPSHGAGASSPPQYVITNDVHEPQAKHERASSSNCAATSDDIACKEREASNSGKIPQETQLQSMNTSTINDASLFYDTISSVFGAAAANTPSFVNASDPDTAQISSENERALANTSLDGQQSPNRPCNFLDKIPVTQSERRSSPPVYTELTSPQRLLDNKMTHSFGETQTEHHYHSCRMDGYQHDPSLVTHQQHYQRQQQLQRCYPSPHQSNESTPNPQSSLHFTQPNIRPQNYRSSNVLHGNSQLYNTNSNQANIGQCNIPGPNRLPYTPSHHRQPQSDIFTGPHNILGDINNGGIAPNNSSVPFNYHCNEMPYPSTTSSQQAYRNRRINITLTYN